MAAPSAIVVPPAVRRLAAFVVVVALALCAWQVQRDGERNAGREAAQQVAEEPVVTDNVPITEALAWRVVRWRGRWEGVPHLIAGRQEKAGLGYGLAQLFVRDDGARLLVDRGWIPAEGVAEVVRQIGEGGAVELVAQLRPAFGNGGAVALAGHGTSIWAAKTWPSIQAATEAKGPLVGVAGGEGGGRQAMEPPLDGFERVPARDDTSLHYAAQWLAIAGIGAIILTPAALRYARRILGA